MKALVVFDKFKDSMSASEANQMASDALYKINASFSVEFLELTDGGEGFARIVTQALGGELRQKKVTGPQGKPVEAVYGWLKKDQWPSSLFEQLQTQEPKDLALIEMAQASGLQQVPVDQRNLWLSSSRGTGELIRHVCQTEQAGGVLLGIGGSATHDLGLGALQAMGACLKDSNGQEIQNITPETFSQLGGITWTTDLHYPSIWMASDVLSPLLGSQGAAQTYASQKGLGGRTKEELELLTQKVAEKMCENLDQPSYLMSSPGSGAAGGIGFGLSLTAKAKFIPGFDFVQSLIKLDEKIQQTDFVLTGEGRFDESSIHGKKGPFRVLEQAEIYHKPVLLVGGEITPEALRWITKNRPLVQAFQLRSPQEDLQLAVQQGPQRLFQTVRNKVPGLIQEVPHE